MYVVQVASVDGDSKIIVFKSSILRSNFNRRHQTKIIVHGFLQTGNFQYIVDTTAALLDKSPMNVIVVAWENGATFPYSQAVANTRLVGAQLAALLETMVQARNADMARVHIIGHSLGAHIAGYAGASTPGLGRISGLDPAQPGYHNFSEEVRLDKSDARFVDVIHTDAIPFGTIGGYGIIEPIGDIDFYPNAGRHQPGCMDESTYVGVVEDLFGDGLSVTESRISCSHERSTQLFLASILHSSSNDHHQCYFRAVHCESFESFMRGECLNCLPNLCPIMGIEAPTSRARGVHYLKTTSNPGFCGFQYFVTLNVSETSMPYAHGDLELMIIGNLASTNWTHVYLGDLLPGNMIPSMVLSSTDIGNPTEVRVRAHYIYGLFSWTTYQVTLNQVKVDSIMEFNTHFFCREGMVLYDGEYISLTSPLYEGANCIWS
ncbi:pancreatic triacylglycerol lipase [Elysia marginata]|uniref:Pancreatic triacylglycerol lipase n=1 Tax=Elysia marginata TaxID=1093978 RepID=A0AAV4ITF0_9GAST|nr:pancreatic triacylglycerol lipase [Elysia marginata]